MAEGAGTEEQFVLRVLDEALADKLRKVLREEITAHGHIELNFSGMTGLASNVVVPARACQPLTVSLNTAPSPPSCPFHNLHLVTDNNQDGTLTVDGVLYPVKLLNLPTVVEAYKTYDDVNLVKINDIGQVGPCLPALLLDLALETEARKRATAAWQLLGWRTQGGGRD